MQDNPRLHVAGVPVHFPYLPYRAQNALMHAVVTAVKGRKHALIESPTGTGKSLALLCSSLAVQKHFIKLQDVQSNEETIERATKPSSSRSERELRSVQSGAVTASSNAKEEDEDDMDFAPPKKFRDTSWQKPIQKRFDKMPDEEPENAFMFDRLLSMRTEVPLDTFDGSHIDREELEPKPKIPRIFYATRTHSQVAQVIGELRKTIYTPSLSILASRKEYCINDAVKAAPNRDETCKLLLSSSNNACPLFRRSETLANSEELDHQPWDIEELVELGNKHSGCPYYASHHLYQRAQLILCPYSFLIDPICRKARGINVSGDIVILDEAHNIESYARESATFEADVANMSRAAEQINKMLLLNCNGDLKIAYSSVKDLLYKFVTMAENIVSSGALKDRDRQEDAVFERDEIVIKLHAVEITSSEVNKWKSAYDFIITYSDEDARKTRTEKREWDDGTPSMQTLSPTQRQRPIEKNIESTAFFGYGHDPNVDPARNDEDRAAVQPRKIRRTERHRNAERRKEMQAWVSRGLSIVNQMLTTLEYLFEHPDDFTMVVVRRTVNFVTAVNISICCLNAAICFREISSRARSVIVTSGTLTPIRSFAGELGTNFSIAKALPHVVNVKNQLFVGLVGEGPKRVPFDATFRGSSTFAFQDALGDALVDYCKVIPGGVLVFFPSYRMMDQMQRRWRVSGAWERLENVKGVLLAEPNHRGEDFDNIVSAYQKGSSSEDGALLLAVCRGKLSEGIDFRDQTSRGVILIGIPFPYIRDVVVIRKKAWNDRIRQEKKRMELQSGGEWYEMQGYRAMNQALGRVLRHRYDYGAILLVDRRFRHERVCGQLPGWTREAIRRTNSSHEDIVQGLKQFYASVQQKIAELAEDDQKYQPNWI